MTPALSKNKITMVGTESNRTLLWSKCTPTFSSHYLPRASHASSLPMGFPRASNGIHTTCLPMAFTPRAPQWGSHHVLQNRGSHHQRPNRVHTTCLPVGFTSRASQWGSNHVPPSGIQTTSISMGFTQPASHRGSHHEPPNGVRTTSVPMGFTPPAS